jgi:hypothetical protein
VASLLIKKEFSIFFFFKLLVENLITFPKCYPTIYRSREIRFLSIPLRKKSYKTLIFEKKKPYWFYCLIFFNCKLISVTLLFWHPVFFKIVYNYNNWICRNVRNSMKKIGSMHLRRMTLRLIIKWHYVGDFCMEKINTLIHFFFDISADQNSKKKWQNVGRPKFIFIGRPKFKK